MLLPGVSVTGYGCEATGAPGHPSRGLVVVLSSKVPGFPSGLHLA